MPLDTSIYAPRQAVNPFEVAARFEAQDAAMQNNKLAAIMNQAKIDEYRRGVDRENKLMQALQGGAGADELQRQGFLEPAMKLRKEDLERQKAQLDMGKTQAETGKLSAETQNKQFELQKNINGFVGSGAYAIMQNPTYENALAITRQVAEKIAPFAPDMAAKMDGSQIPRDPAQIKQMFNNFYLKSVDVAKLLEAQTSRDNNAATNATSRANNAATNATTIRRQNLVDARQREAMNTPQYMETADGIVALPKKLPFGQQPTAIPVMGQNGQPINTTKLTESAKKQITGIDSLGKAIDEYTKTLSNWKSADIVSPDKRAEMGTKYNNMMLQAKEAYNLGVLNGPDYDILTSIVTDPSTLKGAITSTDAMAKQATELKRIMQGTRQAVANQGRSPTVQPTSIDDLLKKYGQ
jgi:hypothetical protein